MNSQNLNVHTLTQLGLLLGLEAVMRLMGFGAVPVGPLNMSFLTVPIAVGGLILGPLGGGVLGLAFGLFSLYDAMSGRSVMTSTFFGISPFHTIVLTVGTRVLMGVLSGWISNVLKKQIGKHPIRYVLSALSAPLLNTLLFMGYIVLVFYRTDYVQNLVAMKGATNPLTFVILLVGIQGIIEALVCAVIGGASGKAVELIVKH